MATMTSTDTETMATTSAAAAPLATSAPIESDDAHNERKRALASPSAAATDSAPPAADSLVRKKQRKRDKHAAMAAGGWDRCMFKLVRKNRFCNMERIAGALFCGNHLPADASVASKKAQKFKADFRKRVPCPVDKRHTVYAYDLDKHVLVCNTVKDAQAMAQLPYYIENINSGTHCAPDASAPVPTDVAAATVTTDAPSEDAATEHLGLSATDAQSLVDKLLGVDFADLARRIHAAYARCVGSIPLEKLSHPCCDALLAAKRDAGAAQNILRHIEQQASILGHMDRVALLAPDNAAVYVELGAGRGMLSLALAQTRSDSVFVLIDRAHSRGKADRFIESAEVDAQGADGPSGSKGAAPQALKTHVVRAKIDIRHLNFAGMSELSGKPVVCMSKHLCGVATDLSLRAITQTLPRSPRETADASALSSLFRGLAVALCCHHVCTYADYVNPEFFEQQGFSASEFALLTSMTSWATCGMGVDGDTVEHALGMRKADRVTLGRECKRILDAGRAAYLAGFGLQTQLVHYCAEADSIENCLLLAWR